MKSYPNLHILIIGVIVCFAQLSMADQNKQMIKKNPFVKPIKVIQSSDNDSHSHESQHDFGEMKLQGTLTSNTDAIANINGELFFVGDYIDGFELVKVGTGYIVLTKDGIESKLTVNDKYKDLQ